MIEGFVNDRSFMIPMQRSWYYPSYWAYDFRRPAMNARSPFEGFEVHPTSSQCQCFNCQRRIQRQDKYHCGEERKRYGNGNISDRAHRYREIPIHVENKGKGTETRSKFDNDRKGKLKKDRPKIPGDMKVDAAKKRDDVALADAGSNRILLTQGRQNEGDIKGSSGMDIETDKADIAGDDSQFKTNSMKDPTVTEEPKKINEEEVKQTKLGKILQISNDFEQLSERVDSFQGTERCKEYLYLEEMLMKCLLRLDEISTDGISDVRKSRKRVANMVNEKLKRLEEKLEGDSTSSMIEIQGSIEIMKNVGISPCEANVIDQAESTSSEANVMDQAESTSSEANVIDQAESTSSEANEVGVDEYGDKNEINKTDCELNNDGLCHTPMQNQSTNDLNCDEGMLQDSGTSEIDISNCENGSYLNKNETEKSTEDLEPSGKSDLESSNSGH